VNAAKGKSKSKKKKRALPTENEKLARKRTPRKRYRYTCSADECTNKVIKGGGASGTGQRLNANDAAVKGAQIKFGMVECA
jgi:hypothetical protein